MMRLHRKVTATGEEKQGIRAFISKMSNTEITCSKALTVIEDGFVFYIHSVTAKEAKKCSTIHQKTSPSCF